jgi:MutS domain V
MNSPPVSWVLPGIFEILAHLRERSNRGKRRRALREGWGRPVARRRDFGRYPACLSYRSLAGQPNYIDGQTWSDLNLDAVFASMDRTITSPGEIELYRILRLPEHDEARLVERDRMITELQSDARTREELQLILHGLGRFNHAPGMISFLWLPPQPRPLLWRLCTLLAFTAYSSIIASVLAYAAGSNLRSAAFCMIVLTFLVNMVVHFTGRVLFGADMLSARYLGACIATARRIAMIEHSGLDGRLTELARISRHLPSQAATLLRSTSSMEPAFVVQDYLSIISLFELRTYLSLISQVDRLRDELQRLFISVGELDAYQAIASYRTGLKAYSRPNFCGGRGLEIQGAYHPLLGNAVENSLDLRGRNCVVMGSNMSGKSTFLRTIGVNVIMAQSIYTCTAAGYRGKFVDVISSISVSDDLLAGKSLFMAEAERLLEIIVRARSAHSLCLLDEILRGTNAAERIAAAKAIVRYLAECDSVTMVATHDLQVLDGLPSSFDVVHFEDRVDLEGLHFDYRLIQGAPKSTNAIRILEFLGFPDGIIRDAEREHRRATGMAADPEASGES